MSECQTCKHGLSPRLAPCPDGRPGCCVAHYDKNSWVCPGCGKDYGPAVAEAFRTGNLKEEIGVAVVNMAAVFKLELYDEEKKNDV